METTLKTSLWQQFGAAIDTLEEAMHACPDHLWQEGLWDHPADPPEFSQYWYLVYHTLFWLDLYLSGAVEGFSPPAPFTLDELKAGLLPERPYSRDELQAYPIMAGISARRRSQHSRTSGPVNTVDFHGVKSAS